MEFLGVCYPKPLGFRDPSPERMASSVDGRVLRLERPLVTLREMGSGFRGEGTTLDVATSGP